MPCENALFSIRVSLKEWKSFVNERVIMKESMENDKEIILQNGEITKNSTDTRNA